MNEFFLYSCTERNDDSFVLIHVKESATLRRKMCIKSNENLK